MTRDVELRFELLRAALMESESRPDKHPVCVFPNYFGLSGQYGDGCQRCPFMIGKICVLQWVMGESNDPRDLLQHMKEAGSQPKLTPFFESDFSRLHTALGKHNLDKIYSRLPERYKSPEDPQPKSKGRFAEIDLVEL